MLQRLFGKRVGLWVLIPVLIALFIYTVGYGAVLLVAASGSNKFGLVGDLALGVARLPHMFKIGANAVLRGQAQDLLAEEQRFKGQAGFQFSYPAGSRPQAGYLLLSRYDGNRARSIIEMVDMNSQQVVHTWQPDAAEMNRRSTFASNIINLSRDNIPERARFYHPLLTDDGALVVHNISPAVKLDACSRIMWMVDRVFHHGSEPDPVSGYWVPYFVEPQHNKDNAKTYEENAMAHLAPNGDVLFEKSIDQLLDENGYGYLVLGQDSYSDDPIHLNDIQPVTSDSPYWRLGDLFISMRNISAIALYRPSENKVVWLKQGPWIQQHDIDILDDHRISIFNNNQVNAAGRSYVRGSNEMMIYDFATDTVTSPYAESMRKLEIRTKTEGLGRIFPNGDVFVEETNYGRALRFNAEGDVVWSYVNRASDGRVYLLTWSRTVDRARGDAMLAKVKAAGCERQ